jgi:hypothetical protein
MRILAEVGGWLRMNSRRSSGQGSEGACAAPGAIHSGWAEAGTAAVRHVTHSSRRAMNAKGVGV